jgi:hypothetical protein
MSPVFGEDRLSQVRRECRERLAPACAGWPRPLFDRLVDSIASITLKYERIVGDLSFDRSGPPSAA